MKCPYCGNSSGKTDSRGGCISCGGDLLSNDAGNLSSYNMMIESGFMSVNKVRQHFGITGGYSYQSIYDLPEVKEVSVDFRYNNPRHKV